MKNKKTIILWIAILFAVAGVVHTAISFVSILNSQFTSVPATVAFFILIPYFVCSAVALVIWIVSRRKSKGNQQ